MQKSKNSSEQNPAMYLKKIIYPHQPIEFISEMRGCLTIETQIV